MATTPSSSWEKGREGRCVVAQGSSSSSEDDENDVAVRQVAPRAVKAPRRRCMIINTSKCRYHIVRQAALELGWVIEDDDRADVPSEYSMTELQQAQIEKWFPNFRYHPDDQPQVHWVDTSILLPRVKSLKCFHRLNHFPNMHLICRKMIFFSRCMKLQQRFPEWYSFFPKSFSLRTDFKALNDYFRSLKGKTKTFVMKPNTGCEGKGILLTRNPVKVAKSLPDQDYIVQLYVHRPLLIDGKKFDMRVYVLVTFAGSSDTFDGRNALDGNAWWLDAAGSSTGPVTSATSPSTAGGGLQVFIHREGLVRICSEAYSKPTADNLKDVYKHLTNYALNKKNENYVYAGDAVASNSDEDEETHDSGCDLSFEGDGTEGLTSNKRDFRFLAEYVTTNGMSIPDVRREWSRVAGGAAVADDDEDGVGACATGAALPPSGEALDEDLWTTLLKRIDRAVVLSILSGVREVKQAYHAAGGISGPRADGRNGFELMGFDVMLTRSGQVHILEINHSPSMFCDTPLDVRVKKNVVKDTLRIVTRGVPDVRKCSDYGYRRHIEKLKRGGEESPIGAPSIKGTQFRQCFPLVCPPSASLSQKDSGSAWAAIAEQLPNSEHYLLDRKHCETEMNVYKTVWNAVGSGDAGVPKAVVPGRTSSGGGPKGPAPLSAQAAARRTTLQQSSATVALPSIRSGHHLGTR